MLISKTTQDWLDSYISRPRAALLVDSPNDIVSAVTLAGEVYSKLIEDKSNPLLRVTLSDKKSIGIEDIRELQRILHNKANKTTNNISRVALIEHADKMTIEAQNALLKLLEELPENTVLILACSNKSTMLKTILSRCFLVPILPISKEQALEYALQKNINKETSLRAFMLSEGKPSLFLSLLHEQENTLEDSVQLAKLYMQSTVVQRQKINESLIKDSVDIHIFLSSLELITKVAMRGAKDTRNRQLWKGRLKVLLEIKTQLEANVSAKLVLLNLSVSL